MTLHMFPHGAGTAAAPSTEIYSDDLSDNPSALVISRQGIPTVVGDIGATWIKHSSSPAEGTLRAETGGLLPGTAATGEWIANALPTGNMVIETSFNTINPNDAAQGIIFWSDETAGRYLDGYVINLAGTGSGGCRVGRIDGGLPITRLSTWEIQGVANGRIRVEVNATTLLCKFWSDYIANPQETGGRFASGTLPAAKSGKRVGWMHNGSSSTVKRVTRFRYGRLGDF